MAKTKALISFAVTSKLICAFVFAYADCWFSHEAAHLLLKPILYFRGANLTEKLLTGILNLDTKQTIYNSCIPLGACVGIINLIVSIPALST